MSAFICSVCTIRGRHQMFCTDHNQWVPRDVEELRLQAWAYKNAQTLVERKAIFETHGVRWSSLWLLDYWNPTRMLVIDTMHCILEGLVHYHCRHVLRLDASAPKLNAEGFRYAFEWPWIPYDHETVPTELRIQDKHILTVAKIQQTLCLALAGSNAITLDRMWTRLDNQSTQGALKYVVHSLELTVSLSNVDQLISSLYVDRVKRKSKKNNSENSTLPHTATRKNHFVALLLDWRLKQPLSSDAYIINTGTPETLTHIQKVIRETVTPSWLNSVPKNFGEPKAGSIKADEWRTLSVLYLPIALITLWGDDDGLAPSNDESDSGYLFKALEHTMALFQATVIVCRYTMTASRTDAYRKYIDSWVNDLRTLYPHTRQGVPRPNIHAAGHVYDFLLLFGPVVSWWCFPFERLIGALQKINTSDHIGGRFLEFIIHFKKCIHGLDAF
ncbi:hypothetical protein DFH05DRAFT_1406384 [Lentinula detonsa]|uniref:Uncharacterized protein n=1 Tax=Lentinula detonsa TaxID=2804962 RepID=A0A9W8NSC7_9AGAR|nr:hypothetical protein DFH05DRAFT_1406384 [Lentinula detonsa]